ncbi:MAG: DUF1330 domain-containing protein [Alphaproteobacteria bacterium]|nr:DUF1330 domain-containing protein [Alphaproteobacteria bacterium]
MADHVNPEREIFARFKDLPRDQPIHMLNLVRLKPFADYEDGRSATGADAYRAYARESGPVFERLGGKQIWIAEPQLMLTGPQSEAWDIAFIAEYPSGQAFIDMLRDPDYREAVKHRTAAVADSRLLRLKPGQPGAHFGEIA